MEHPTLSEAAVAAFDVISVEFPQLHLPVIKHLFKQKLFQLCLKGFWHKLESYSENHLSAFVFVMKLTPHQVLKNEIQKVIGNGQNHIKPLAHVNCSSLLKRFVLPFQIGPVLLKCLTLKAPKSLLAALNIIKHFVTEQNEFFRDHLQNVIPQCLKLTTCKESIDIRIDAIDILSGITLYPAFIVLPFAQDVLLGLQAALDDHKRVVRNSAVLARNKWFFVGVEQ